MASVQLKGISKRFGDNEILKRIDLEVKDQEFLVLVGPSGCGKTTSLRIVAGLEEASEGVVFIGDRDVTNVLPKDRNIAMVFQSYALYPHLNVYDNMAFGLKLRRIGKSEIQKRVGHASEILGLNDLLKRKPRQLSGGQRQRVALGRAIVRQPDVFLMDEPLSNLDAKLRVQTRAEIKKLHSTLKTTVIYVTHDQVEAMTMGSRIVIMNEGQIQQIDRPIDIYDNPRNMYVAGFIGSPGMNFIEGRVQKEQDKYIFQTESFKVWLPDNLYEEFSVLKDKTWILGIRPENILDKSTAEFLKADFNLIKATVDFCEVFGYENYIHCQHGSIRFTGKVDPHITPNSGQAIELAMDLRKMHLFDPETQTAVI